MRRHPVIDGGRSGINAAPARRAAAPFVQLAAARIERGQTQMRLRVVSANGEAHFSRSVGFNQLIAKS